MHGLLLADRRLVDDVDDVDAVQTVDHAHLAAELVQPGASDSIRSDATSGPPP